MLRASFKNFHAVGLYSVMLLDEDGRRIRLFVARDGHTLWRNDPELDHPMSLGFFTAPCDASLEVLGGELSCLTLQKGGGVSLHEHAFETGEAGPAPASLPASLRESVGRGAEPDAWHRLLASPLRHLGKTGGFKIREKELEEGEGVDLSAGTLFTIFIADPFPGAVWLSYEGAAPEKKKGKSKAGAFQPLYYSNEERPGQAPQSAPKNGAKNAPDHEKLFAPLTESEIEALLNDVDLL
jgi:hypothetical protein